jgi:alkanesulfonate monooxygenase SsuD/methylene tetrahydromethanopterin reductase-like flavin-dependent oxidoreductase (luciferase family)
MKFGTYFFLQASPGRSGAEVLPEEVDQMVLAEELGFDSIWLTEHHYADYGLSSAPSVLLATVAARTRRIRLGIAVYVIPFHHPLRLAEETASIDILSGGRLIVGLGRGNRPMEFFGHGSTTCRCTRSHCSSHTRHLHSPSPAPRRSPGPPGTVTRC